jgi:hypothetical protein
VVIPDNYQEKFSKQTNNNQFSKNLTNLEQLHQAGFQNDIFNEVMLKMYNNNVKEVLNALSEYKAYTKGKTSPLKCNYEFHQIKK